MHEPRVLERDAEAAGERLEELQVGLAEGVLAVDVLERDRTGGLASGDKRDEENRLRGLAGQDRAAVSLGLGEDVLGDKNWLLRLEHMPGEAARRLGLSVQPLA